MVETINKLVRTSRQLLQELQRTYRREIAEKWHLPQKGLGRFKKSLKSRFLETPIGEEEDSHLGDFIEDVEALAQPSCIVYAVERTNRRSALHAERAGAKGFKASFRSR